MKKIFTLITCMILGMAAQAETLVDYSRGTVGLTASGTCNLTSGVKVLVNTKTISGIEFGNSYKTDGALNDNYVKVDTEGGFKKGDVITIAGAFNNSDDSKLSAADIFTLDAEGVIVPLFSTEQFINGRNSEDMPIEEVFTLEEDVEVLYIGRNGNTKTFVTTFKVVRGDETPVEPEPEPDVEEGVVFDYQMIAKYEDKDFVEKFGILTLYGSTTTDYIKVNNNTNSVPGIKFANSYKVDEKLSDNYATISTEGGFKKGDVVEIAGAFNNSDDSKQAAVALFTLDEEENIVVLFTTEDFINGRTNENDPEIETYELEEDMEILYLGRKGNTATFVTHLKVLRNGDQPEPDPSAIKNATANAAAGTMFNLAGQQVNSSYKGIVVMNGKKSIRK